MGEQIRLDRFLAQEGIGSRTDVKKMIRSGRIRVNSQTVGKGELKIDPEEDEILVDDRRVSLTVLPTLMLNKPAGVVSATEDAHDRTVIGLIDEPWAGKLFPVGRLDKDTEGLLLLTGDGQMAHELLSPKKHVVKTYYAVVSGAPDPELVHLFREGIDIGEKKRTLPAELLFLPAGGSFPLMITLSGEETLKETPSEKKLIGEKPLLSEKKLIGEKPLLSEKKLIGEKCSFSENELTEIEADQKNEMAKTSSLTELPVGVRSITQRDLDRCGEEECCVVISITEGKFHQIKRMFGAVGREVHFLKRIAMGGLELDPELSPGQYRALSEEELGFLR